MRESSFKICALVDIDSVLFHLPDVILFTGASNVRIVRQNHTQMQLCMYTSDAAVVS